MGRFSGMEISSSQGFKNPQKLAQGQISMASLIPTHTGIIFCLRQLTEATLASRIIFNFSQNSLPFCVLLVSNMVV